MAGKYCTKCGTKLIEKQRRRKRPDWHEEGSGKPVYLKEEVCPQKKWFCDGHTRLVGGTSAVCH